MATGRREATTESRLQADSPSLPSLTATGQLSFVAGPRTDAIRAAGWAVHSLELNPPVVPVIY
jgi:hypothetical protein